MTVLTGKSVCAGYAFGKIAFYSKQDHAVKKVHILNTEAEIRRFIQARNQALQELNVLYEKAKGKVGESGAQIFEIHKMMIEDTDYYSSVVNIIETQTMNSEYAVAETSENFSRMLSQLDDNYMKERVMDVADVSERIIRILSEVEDSTFALNTPAILAAMDLSPSETVQLDKTMLHAIVTAGGSSNSHTAILARMMNIPAIIGLGEDLSAELHDKSAIVDGFSGKIIIEPDDETLAHYQTLAERAEEGQRQIEELKNKENVTLDGQKVEVFSNAGSVDDIQFVQKNDAGGIGLFRSEFLYMQKNDYPTEDEQFEVYKTIAENMDGRRVIIRTMDIGADKNIDYFGLEKEENPALGFRAIRICLERPDLFKTQLRALYRASAFGNISIMFPMITDIEEVLEIKKIVKSVQQELLDEQVSFSDKVELGIMVETPAAVMVSDILAKEVDFFSVGTNDLTQYLLAVDRQNPNLEKYHRPHHTGLLRCIKIAADNAHKEGKWIGICGELAADTELTEMFLAFGIDELSVPPSCILKIREKVRTTDVSKVKDHWLGKL